MTRAGAVALLCRMLRQAAARDFARPPTAADWRQLIAIGTQWHVATAVHPALARAGLLDRVPGDVAEYLDALTQLNRERNEALLAELADVARRLNAAGLVPRVLKGAALLVDGVYADPGERLMVDLDLLVERAALERARRVLVAAGYRARGPGPSPHHLAPLAHPRRRGVIELHWQQVPSGRGHDVLAGVAGQDAAPWRRVAFRGAELAVPSPTLAAAHRVVHDLVHDRGYWRGWTSLRGMLDVRRLAGADGAAVDVERLAAAFAAAGLGRQWRAYADALHRHFPGLPAPSFDIGARLWHLRFLAHQQWPGLYTATRGVFRHLRPWLPREWLQYWGWPALAAGERSWRRL
jgi:hypothetical protein